MILPVLCSFTLSLHHNFHKRTSCINNEKNLFSYYKLHAVWTAVVDFHPTHARIIIVGKVALLFTLLCAALSSKDCV